MSQAATGVFSYIWKHSSQVVSSSCTHRVPSALSLKLQCGLLPQDLNCVVGSSEQDKLTAFVPRGLLWKCSHRSWTYRLLLLNQYREHRHNWSRARQHQQKWQVESSIWFSRNDFQTNIFTFPSGESGGKGAACPLQTVLVLFTLPTKPLKLKNLCSTTSVIQKKPTKNHLLPFFPPWVLTFLCSIRRANLASSSKNFWIYSQ